MPTQDFIEKFSTLLTETPAETLTAGTEFKKLPDWNSLLALSLIALIEDEYEVLLKSTDIRDAETLENLAEIVRRAQ